MNKVINLNNLCKLSVGTLVCVFGLNIIMSNTLSTKGMELSAITRETDKIEKENLNLSFEISRETSIAYVEQKALSLGFVKITKPVALFDLSGVAMANE